MNATSQTAEIDTGSKKPTQEAKPATIDRNVLALGWVAFFGGLALDMIQPLLPAFYRSVLGLSTEFIGLIEGSLTTVVSLMKIGAGYLSDALGVRKAIVFVGYALSAADTQRRQTVPVLLSFHFMNQSDDDSGTGAADGMSQRDTATERVHLLGADTQFAEHTQRL